MGVVNTLASRSEHLRVRHELGLLARQVGGEVCREVSGSEKTKPSCVLTSGLEALGNFFLPLAASVSPSSGAYAAMYRRAATWESVPASVMTASP